jgi:hypothetical protein
VSEPSLIIKGQHVQTTMWRRYQRRPPLHDNAPGSEGGLHSPRPGIRRHSLPRLRGNI